MSNTLALSRPHLSRFDSLVIATLVSLALLTGLMIWRGDQVGARVLSVTPPAGADKISPNTEIRLTFDQPMQSPPADSFLTFSPPVTGSLRWQAETLIFSPAAPLKPDTTYTVTLPDNLISEQGRQLQNFSEWQFTTRHPYILYLKSDDNENEQLFMVDPVNGSSRQLTTEETGIFDYTISPRGTTIAYSVWTAGGGRDLKRINPDTGQINPLLNCPEAACNGLVWSPDGQRIVYERRPMLVPGAAPGPPRLWWLSPDGGNTVPIFEDNQILGYGAGWSPDGRWLSYVAPSSQGVQVYNIAEGSSVLIPSRTGALPVWSPQDNTLIVSDIQASDEGFAAHLFRATPEQGELTNLSGPGTRVEDSSPAWSPDGTWLAFARKVAGTAMGKQIGLMRPDGSEDQLLTDEPNIHHSFPSWSPDGQYLIFQRFSLKELGSVPSIWRLNIETQELDQIAEAGSQPSWLP